LATMTIDRTATVGRARLLARLILALAAAMVLGYGAGHLTAHQAQPTVIKYVPVTVNSDQPGKAPSHREVW
jgi:hypothetical protein